MWPYIIRRLRGISLSLFSQADKIQSKKYRKEEKEKSNNKDICQIIAFPSLKALFDSSI